MNTGPEGTNPRKSPEERRVEFVEFGTHKTIRARGDSGMSGQVRVSDQATIDALREAFEHTGWMVVDK